MIVCLYRLLTVSFRFGCEMNKSKWAKCWKRCMHDCEIAIIWYVYIIYFALELTEGGDCVALLSLEQSDLGVCDLLQIVERQTARLLHLYIICDMLHVECRLSFEECVRGEHVCKPIGSIWSARAESPCSGASCWQRFATSSRRRRRRRHSSSRSGSCRRRVVRATPCTSRSLGRGRWTNSTGSTDGFAGWPGRYCCAWPTAACSASTHCTRSWSDSSASCCQIACFSSLLFSAHSLALSLTTSVLLVLFFSVVLSAKLTQ